MSVEMENKGDKMFSIKDVIVPNLKIDDILKTKHNLLSRAERRIVAALISYLWENNWKAIELSDGDDFNKVKSTTLSGVTKELMEQVFNLDDCRIYFKKGKSKIQGVYLVRGNNPDEIICDYHVGEEDFDNHMSIFFDLIDKFMSEE